jgi:hypothetical protein
MRDGRLEASGHNWVEGQGSGPRIDKADGEEDVQYDAMGNKIDVKKLKKISAGEARKVCLCLVLFRYILTTVFHSLRRSAWHGRSGVRRSQTTSSDRLRLLSLYFRSFFPFSPFPLVSSGVLLMSYTHMPTLTYLIGPGPACIRSPLRAPTYQSGGIYFFMPLWCGDSEKTRTFPIW